MVDKIFAQYDKLKGILRAFNEGGKTEESKPKLIEDVKAIIKEFSEILDESKGE